ncbi:MAG: AraC family transcriptional regulator [Anaerolineae bacterium]
MDYLINIDLSKTVMQPIRIQEGFHNQQLYRLPQPILEKWGNHPLLQSLIPTDVGWFPNAQYHYCQRKEGLPGMILIFCVKGEGWFKIGDGPQQRLNTNEALFIPSGVPHVYGSSEQSPWSIHWIHLSGLESISYATQFQQGKFKLRVDKESSKRAVQLFRQCYDILAEGFVLNRLIYAAKVSHNLLGELFFNNSAFSAYQRSNRLHSIESTLNYLRQNMSDRLSLTEMAQHANLSVPHFSRLFREQTGYAPVDYFIHLKLQKASSLLNLTDMSVREIASSVGYEDPYYFSRLFKKVIGISPTAARNQLI